MNDFERTRNAAASGGPEYRATAAGKGDVNRTRGKGLTKYALGMDLINVAEKYGKDSPEYAKALEAWREAQD